MSIDDSRGYDLLDQLAEEFAARFRRGERPSLKDYTERYPELADEIRELFPALIKVEQVEEICQHGNEAETRAPSLSQVGDFRIIRQVGRGGMGIVYEAEQVSLGRRVALKVLPWQVAKHRTSLERFRREARASARLHHTNIVPVFEVGQDGEVCFYAMQFIQGQSLDAVIDELRRLRSRSHGERRHRPDPADPGETRISSSGTRGTGTRLEVAQSLLSGRFERGPAVAPAAAFSERLGCPGGSAPAPPAGPDTSAVMPGGAQLSSVESRHRAFHRGVAHIGRQAASALAHAHARGIVHRDIKPSNLLLDTEGVVWVSDFGLAKVDDDDLTRTGDILGTVRYMAPERFRGHGDARADIYSLGLTLYELLLLRPAFDAPDRVALCEQIRTLDPPRPRSIDHRVPRDLETVVLKAIEKDPKDRYASADALAEDLRRYLDDEPIQARRARPVERYLRWARRNPVIAVLGGVLTALLIGATVASVVVAGRMAALAERRDRAARSERDAKLTAQAALSQSEADRREAGSQRDRAEESLYHARISLAENALHRSDPSSANEVLNAYLPKAGAPDRRGWEWHYLSRQCSPLLCTLQSASHPAIYGFAVSPDGRFLVAAGGSLSDPGQTPDAQPATVDVYDLPDLTFRRTLAGHWGKACAAAFRPDGKCLATAATDGRVTIWETSTWRALRTFAGGTFDCEAVRANVLQWSPDGRRLAVNFDESVWIGDPETLQMTARIDTTSTSATWSPDGTRIAAIAMPQVARVWDAVGGPPLGPALKSRGVLKLLLWAPPGQCLIGVGADGTRTTWDVATGRVLEERAVLPRLDGVAASRDGSIFVIDSRDGLLRVVDAARATVTATLFHGAGAVRALALSPDGHRLFVGGLWVRGVKVFDLLRGPGGRIAPAQWQLCAMAFDERGEMLRTINSAGPGGAELEMHNVDTGVIRPGPRLPVSRRALHTRGDFAFSPDGRQLAAPRDGADSEVGVWDVTTGQEVASLRAPGTVNALAYGAGGTRLATGLWDDRRNRGEVVIWDLATGRALRTIDAGPHSMRVVAFSADGRMVAAGGGEVPPDNPGWTGAWDTETGARRVTFDRAGSIRSLAFSPDGSRLAATDIAQRNFYLWDLKAGTVVRRRGPAGVGCVTFTPDGTRVASVGHDGQVHLADARTGEELLILRSATRPVGALGFTPRLAISRDGSRLAANGAFELSFWETGATAQPDPVPQPVDVAGWLRQGRALAGHGDTSGAEAAYACARGLDDSDPSPWIEHALVLWRRGDAAPARDALARAIACLPDDGEHWTDLGRLVERFGWPQESETALAKARSLASLRLSRAPDDEAAAAALAELLPEADESRGWTTLRPAVMTSRAGATLTLLPDGSVSASGRDPVADTYTVEAATGLSLITGVRIEAIPDPKLPQHGPGRNPTGEFRLAEFRVSAATEPGGPAAVPVRLARACADHSDVRAGLKGVEGVLDTDPATVWAIWPLTGRRHWAVFQTDPPIGTGAGTSLRLELVSQARTRATLGRFRLSVTDRPIPLFEPRLMRLKADVHRNGLTRLGAAYFLLGDWASAAAVLERAAAKPDGSALDKFLLALARHHLDRKEEARSDCDRALQRLSTGAGNEETHDVAIAALTAILELSVSQAESLLLGGGLPADPFTP